MPTQHPRIRHYLLIYRPSDHSRLQTLEFEDIDEAQTRFAEIERELQGEQDVDVVMFTARSLESVRRTHPHYFGDGEGRSSIDSLIPA